VASPRTISSSGASDRTETAGGDGPVIRLSGVTRVFGLVPALVRADLAVERGETLLIRGPNGAGKTTLLRVIATALSPTYGTGSVLGFDLTRGREEIRRRTELLGHRTRLYGDLTAGENLRFACRLHGLDPAGVEGALERTGLGRTSRERVRGYSHGMRQRVALARALLRAPEVLLLDEPYAGLDSEAKNLVDDMITEARSEGRTVLLATHDPSRGTIASRTVSMEGGRVLEGVSVPGAVARAASEPARESPSGATGHGAVGAGVRPR
jgi:heme exporter protein A